MFTSVIKSINNTNHMKRTLIIYAAFTMTAAAVNCIYSLFGHGVHSAYMTWMFLYPLVAGEIFYMLIYSITPGATKLNGYRVFYNCYNSGVATLTLGSFLKGILGIAGTSSNYTRIFDLIGWMFIAAALVLILVSFKYKKI